MICNIKISFIILTTLKYIPARQLSYLMNRLAALELWARHCLFQLIDKLYYVIVAWIFPVVVEIGLITKEQFFLRRAL